MMKNNDERQIQGSDFFEQCVKPASLALGRYRSDSFNPVDFVKSNDKGTVGGAQTNLVNSLAMRIDFLRALTSSVTVTKDLELLILDLLLRYTRTKKAGS